MEWRTSHCRKVIYFCQCCSGSLNGYCCGLMKFVWRIPQETCSQLANLEMTRYCSMKLRKTWLWQVGLDVMSHVSDGFSSIEP